MASSPLPLPRKRRLAMLARAIRAVVRPATAGTVPSLSADHFPRMMGRLQIVRDGNGVPHIYAEHEPDLFAALGYLQGADRFILLDVVRHLGAGRLCELIGNPKLPASSEMFPGRGVADLDGFIRPLDFEAQSARDFARLGARGRACLEAFAAGVNAALTAMRGVYPAEYLLLGAVRPWKPSDALLAAATCAFCVALGPLEVELLFDAIRGHLGDDAGKRFFPDAPWENAPTSYRVRDGAEPEPPLHLAAAGSNNWAVAASRSASGAPLVANDPHVPLFPGPTYWYHAHLECPDYRVQGGLILGCPVFGFGHNGHLAWGCTTAYRDGWDLYRVHRLANDPSRYRTPAGTAPIMAHREARRSRFGKEITLAWEQCEHGIIYLGWRHHDGVDLALRMVSSDLARYFEGYLALAASQTVDEHRRALAQINDGPFDFNHVYGHRDGHIGWEVFGRAPRRAGDGLFVRDAHDPAAQWDGFVPFDEMPKILNPARGHVTSANSIVDLDNFRVSTTRIHVEPRHRHERIERTLGGHARHTRETFAALQRDVGTDYGVPLRDALVAALADFATRTDIFGQAFRLLETWSGEFAPDSAAAPVFWFTRLELARHVFAPLLGRALSKRFVNTRRAIPRVERLLLDPNDPLRTDIERASGQSLRDLTSAAFVAAVRSLAARLGNDPAIWRWGALQRIRFGSVLAEIPVTGRAFQAIDQPFGGDLYTVSPSVPVPTRRGLRALVGASSRFICDLARPDEALFAHSSGPSANVASRYFANLTPQWYGFEYFRSALWRPDEVPNVTERLVIEPAK